MRTTRTLLPIVLILAACRPGDDGDGQDSDLPPEAWGRAGDPPAMPGAVKITQEEADALEATSDLYYVPPPDPAAEEQAEQDAMDDAEDVVVAWLQGRGVTGRPINRLLDGEPELGPEDRQLPDGNYDILLPDTGGKRVITLGRPSLLRGLRAVVEKLGDPENATDAYRLIYERFPSSIGEFQLPTPDQVEKLAPAEQLTILGRFVELEDRLGALLDPGGIPPASRPDTCGEEVEAFENWDRQSGNADTEAHSEDGIYANFQWPQKWYATCVKDQAGRGTCGSFGIAAAMETAIALEYDRWVNLSEQDLYFHIRGKWNPVSYGDGIAVHPEWQHMLDNDYLLPFESQWPYNRSDVRVENNVSRVYTDSCDDYQWFDPPSGVIPNYCSDTVHQGGAFCVDVVWWQACGYASAVPVANTSGYRAGDEVEVWDASDPDSSLAITRLALAAKLPTVLWAPVTPTFDGPDANGFANYLGDGEGDRGSHIYQITGFIRNDQLDAQLPDAPPGSGGGYIIAKNSWGDGWSDAGYIYLPYDWVKDYAISVTVLTAIQ